MKRLIAMLVAALVVAPLLSATGPVAPAEAANAALWNPGYIISDAKFYDGGAMNAASIQDFLQQKVPSCQSGFTCLRDYRQDTPTMLASALCPGAYVGATNERASDIIAKVGAACNISQKALLVLLQKEQGLVTLQNPTASRYAKATGFSCPDTAACDPAYAGFFFQVYYAARQFQNYAANPTRWNYQAGRVNNILYNPNVACGASSVYIQNKATAGLYIYTPYQPNAAALSNLYGTGDGCSSYGNRNFWRIYSDWFESPTESSSLVRTTANATVYLISGSDKYPVPSMAVLAGLAPLGALAYVSQSYLDTLTTRHLVGRILRDPGGTIYFYDAGVKLPFTSCAQVADYGASCGSDGYVQLTQEQASAFVTGPPLTSVLGTVEGARYYIKSGTRAEILDDLSQAAAGISGTMNVLTENAVASLPLAPPIIRDGAYVLTRTTTSYSFLAGGMRYPIAAGNEAAMGVPARTTGTLSAASIDLLPRATTGFSGVVLVDGTVSILGGAGRFTVTGGGFAPSPPPVTIPAALAATYPLLGAIAPGTFFKSPAKADVYIVMPTNIRPVGGWDALLALTPDGNPVIQILPQAVIDQFLKGPVAINSGALVRSPANATVYLVNGVTNKIAFSSFIFPAEAGFTQFSVLPQGQLDAYPTAEKLLGFGLACGTDRLVAAGGKVHLVDPTLVSLYPFDYVDLDQFTCARLKRGVPATILIRVPSGSIFLLENGLKRPVTSMSVLAAAAPGTAWLDVVPAFAAAIPTGAPV